MKCPVCEGDTKVNDSRPTAYIKRRRKCLDCEYTFKTYEISYEAIEEVLENRVPRASFIKVMNCLKQEFEGTYNALDYEGRMQKMNPKKVRELRKRHEEGEDTSRLALDYGMDVKSIWRIIKRQRWANVD